MEKSFWTKVMRFGVISIAVCLFLEIFIFNYKSFALIGRNYNQKSISIDDAGVEGASFENGIYTATSEKIQVTFPVNEKIKTMEFAVSRVGEQKKELKVDISYIEASHKEYPRVSDKKFQIVESMPQTKYVMCSYTDTVYSMILNINCNVGEQFAINGLSVNKTVPFNFSLARLLILALLAVIVYVFVKYPGFRQPIDYRKRSQYYGIIAVLVGFMILQVVISNIYVGDVWKDVDTGDQISKELVDSFEAGKVTILEEVPKELLELQNPYDWSQRTAAGVVYKWDHLLYNGKYYSYYGIGPVLTLFLPYHKLTDSYFYTPLAILLYSLIGSLFLALTFLSIVKNWFKKTPYNMTILGLMGILFISGNLFTINRPKFYELAEAAAYCFVAIGAFFMMNSGIFRKMKIRKSFLFLSSLFMSLAVLSRVTSALYCILMVIWLIYGLLQNNKDRGKSAGEITKYVLASITPYVVFGLIQMAYNYARFGNIFEFGIKYSLTINDFTAAKMTMGLLMTTMLNTLFAVPVINTVFPFIHGNYDNMQLNGYYFVDTMCTMGIVVRGLPMLSMLYTPKIAKKMSKYDKLKYTLLLLYPGVIIPLILIGITWVDGYSARYNCDYGWEMLAVGLVIIYYMYNKLENEQLKKWLYRLFVIAIVWCCVSTLAAALYKDPMDNTDFTDLCNPLLYYKLRNTIMFWN